MTDATSGEPDRAERFRDDIAAMHVKTGRADAEHRLQILGVLLMIAGVAIAFGAYRASTNVTATPGTNVDLLNSNAYLPLAIAGLAISLCGGFVWLRYSLARFLRFWLLRQSYEQQVAVERGRGAPPADAVAVGGPAGRITSGQLVMPERAA